MTEYCHRCKDELPAYGHDAICEKCDLILELREKDAEIERLTQDKGEAGMKYAVIAAFLLGFAGGCLLVISLMYANGAMLAEGGPR